MIIFLKRFLRFRRSSEIQRGYLSVSVDRTVKRNLQIIFLLLCGFIACFKTSLAWMLHNKMSVGWAASRDHVKVSDALRTTSEQQHTPHSQKNAKDSTILKVLGVLTCCLAVRRQNLVARL